jgi:hypothetical protein
VSSANKSATLAVVVGFRLSLEDFTKLSLIAKRDGWKPSDYARRILMKEISNWKLQ